MPGRVRAVKRATDPIRGRGRIPLAKRRSSGHPEFRPAGVPTVSALEARIADAVLDAVRSIPHQTFLDAVVSGDADGFGVAVLNRLSEASERIEEALMEAFIVSGETSALELGKELSRAYSKVGKAADVPLPSEVALRFRFDKTDPRATAWVRGEAGQLITNMTNESRLLIRNVIGDAFDSQRTWAQTGRGIFGQLATITPSPSVRDYADALGANLNGLTTRYERAVVNRVTALADDYASRGITGTKALQGMRKEGERYAERLRRSRSRTIARTERMRAHNQARLLSYQQAIESGLASSEYSRKEWQTGPFDVCPICVSTAGQKVKVNEQFTLPNGAQVDCPPAHPNCRCNMTMVTDTRLYQPSDRLGTGLPGDPFRTTPRGFTEAGQTLSQRPLPGVPPVSPATPAQQPPAATQQNATVASADDLASLRQYGVDGTNIRPNAEIDEAWRRLLKERHEIPAERYKTEFFLRTENREIRQQFEETEAVKEFLQRANAAAREAGFKGVGEDAINAYLRRQERVARGRNGDELAELIRHRPPEVTEEEARQVFLRLKDDFAKFLDEAEVSIQIDSSSLSKVLDEGRFKTQFETNKSGGHLDKNYRAREEYQSFGYTKATPDELRPVYGHLEMADIDNTAVGQYGSARVILKRDVRMRTTYTNGDSLGGGYFPQPLNQPNTYDVAWNTKGWPPRFGDAYIETQIHGGVSASDIAEVIFDTGNVGYKEPSKKLLKQLDDAGIRYRFVKSKIEFNGNNNAVRFFDVDNPVSKAKRITVAVNDSGDRVVVTGKNRNGYPKGHIETQSGKKIQVPNVTSLVYRGYGWRLTEAGRRERLTPRQP